MATVMKRVVVDKSLDNSKLHSICFFTTVSTNKENVLYRELKRALPDTLTRATLSGLSFSFIKRYLLQHLL